MLHTRDPLSFVDWDNRECKRNVYLAPFLNDEDLNLMSPSTHQVSLRTLLNFPCFLLKPAPAPGPGAGTPQSLQLLSRRGGRARSGPGHSLRLASEWLLSLSRLSLSPVPVSPLRSVLSMCYLMASGVLRYNNLKHRYVV